MPLAKVLTTIFHKQEANDELRKQLFEANVNAAREENRMQVACVLVRGVCECMCVYMRARARFVAFGWAIKLLVYSAARVYASVNESCTCIRSGPPTSSRARAAAPKQRRT